MRITRYATRALGRTIDAFIDARSGAADLVQRAAAIAALPSKDWRGQPVYQIRCHGDFGRGPHDQFISEYVLWSLIDLNHFVCPYHR